MGDRDRDVRKPQTPPKGIAEQLAPAKFERPGSESWEGADTGQGEAHDEDTPVGLEQMAAVVETEEAKAETRLRNRVKKTAETTQQIKDAVDTTSVGIDTLRFEHKREIAAVKIEVGLVSSKVEKLGTDVAGLSVKLDTNNQMTKFVADQLPVVIKALAVDRKFTQEEEHLVRRKTLEVNAHEAKVEIDEGAKQRQWWRDISLKAVGAVLGLIGSGAVIGYLVTHLSC